VLSNFNSRAEIIKRDEKFWMKNFHFHSKCWFWMKNNQQTQPTLDEIIKRDEICG
jgi:hypothetical protein